MGFEVNYLFLPKFEDGSRTEQLSLALKKYGITPLDLEGLEEIPYVSDRSYVDPSQRLYALAKSLVPYRLLKNLAQLFPSVDDIEKKLFTAIILSNTGESLLVSEILRIYGSVKPDKRLILIDLSVKGFFVFDLPKNVRLIVMPVQSVTELFAVLIRTVAKLRPTFGKIEKFYEKLQRGPKLHPPKNARRERAQLEIGFVTHKGITGLGRLSQDVVYYDESAKNSMLHPENIIHFDYSGSPSPRPDIPWIKLCKPGWVRQAICTLTIIKRFCVADIISLRWKNILGAMLSARLYAEYTKYCDQLDLYGRHLKVAIVDYEILCPKSLLLAFQAKGIRTIAAQERFILAYYNGFGTILNTYLCSSKVVASTLKQRANYCIDHLVPVGQYRSDQIHIARKAPAPKIIERARLNGYKVVTVLGFHPAASWYESKVDTLLNWTAHKHLLGDILALAQDIPNTFFVLRYKNTDWIANPEFSELLLKAYKTGRIVISEEYAIPFFSYHLCAHSDLVIAKHTSLADECLSVGVPVLFHDYQHNSQKLIAYIFDYPEYLICLNFRQLKERAMEVLAKSPKVPWQKYKALENEAYGGLSDGCVGTRIRAHILSELEKARNMRLTQESESF